MSRTIDSFRRRYGENPWHLIAHIAGFAIAAYAIVQLLGQKHWINWLAWFLAAALLHDLVLLPLYSAFDRIGTAVTRRVHVRLPGGGDPSDPAHVPLINHVRAPALISGMLLLIYFPLILGPGDAGYLVRDRPSPLRLPAQLAADHARVVRRLGADLRDSGARAALPAAPCEKLGTGMSASELTGAELAARPSRRGTWLPWAGVAGAGIVVAVGLAIKAATGGLGEALPPFVMSWGPAVNPLVVISLFTIAGALGVAPAIVARAPAGPVFAISVYALALALGLGVNLAHEGVRGWWAVFAPRGSQEGPYEYLTGFDALVHGIPYYIRNFAALFPYLPEHAKGNPPGPLIALDLLGIRTAQALAALCIGLGALTAPLAYDLGRLLGGPTVR